MRLSALPIAACGHGRIVTDPTLRAPEVFLGGEWDEKADIWSFGSLVRIDDSHGNVSEHAYAFQVYQFATAHPLFMYQRNPDLNMDETEYALYFMMAITGQRFKAAQLTSLSLASEYFAPQCKLRNS